jgi:hypothetical protein
MAQIETHTQAPDVPIEQQIGQLKSILGTARDLLPGQILTNEKGELDIAKGTLSEAEIQKRLTEIITDGNVQTYRELSEYQYLSKVLRAVRVWNALKTAAPADKEKLMREYIVANQAATYHEYLPAVVEQTTDVLQQYQELKNLSQRLGIALPPAVQTMEKNSSAFTHALEQNLEHQVRFANASTIRQMLELQKNMGAIASRATELKSIAKPTAAQKEELLRLADLQSWIERLNLKTVTRDDLLKRQKAADMLLTEQDRNVLGVSNEQERLIHSNTMRQQMIDILTGKAAAIGTKEDVAPQALFAELWKTMDKQIVEIQKHLESDLAAHPEKAEEFKKEKEYLKNIRTGMNQDLVAFVHDMGGYQLSLDELTRVQNQIGKHLETGIMTPLNQEVTSKDADALAVWLEKRSDYRGQAIRGALDQTDEMLTIDVPKKIEDWSVNQEKHVLSAAVVLSRFASAMMPSEDSTGILPETYRTIAGFIGLPSSKEQSIKNLSGPLADALGFPPNKTWDELSVIEKNVVLERSKSVIDAIEKFDRGAVTHLRQSMNLVDTMQKEHPISEFAGQEVDGDVVNALSGTRVETDLTGQVINGKTVNRATAFILALRQRRDDWGDPEKRTGYMGQYRMFIDRLESNIQHHLDLGGAMFQMQRAWGEYAMGVLKLSMGGALAAWMLLMLGGAAGVIAVSATKFVAKTTLQGLRAGANTAGRAVRSLPETPGVLNRSKDALMKMRYLQSERQLMTRLESTKIGGKLISSFKTLNNLKIAKAGGTTLKYASWGAIPVMTGYELYIQNQRLQNAKGQDLQKEYKNQMGITALEGLGAGATLLVNGFAPAIVLAAPVLYAGNFAWERADVRANWQRDVVDYANEFDSAGLRQKIEETTGANSVEAGGGGALAPRILFPSTADQTAASIAIEQGVSTARSNAYEAYFMQNLILPPGTDEAVRKKLVSDKTAFIGMATDKGYQDVPNAMLDLADTYADLLQRKAMLERNGEPPLLSYEDENGERQWLDLRLLTPGTATPPDIRSIVTRYALHVQPVEETALFEMMGGVIADEATETGKEKVRAREGTAIRQVLGRKLIHHINDAEKAIRKLDWPGVDVPFVASGNTESQHIVRAYLAGRASEQIDALLPDVLAGNLSAAAYRGKMEEIRSVFLDVINATDTTAILATATDYNAAHGISLDTAKNPLLKLLTE